MAKKKNASFQKRQNKQVDMLPQHTRAVTRFARMMVALVVGLVVLMAMANMLNLAVIVIPIALILPFVFNVFPQASLNYVITEIDKGLEAGDIRPVFHRARQPIIDSKQKSHAEHIHALGKFFGSALAMMTFSVLTLSSGTLSYMILPFWIAQWSVYWIAGTIPYDSIRYVFQGESTPADTNASNQPFEGVEKPKRKDEYAYVNEFIDEDGYIDYEGLEDYVASREYKG